MNKIFFAVLTWIIGLFLHLVLSRYFSFLGVSPHLILLLVVALGFSLGSVTGETFGFFWGLALDSTGLRLFGCEAFLLVLIGYVAGQLRRRLDSERVAPQLVISFFSFLLYIFGLSFFTHAYERGVQSLALHQLILSLILNIGFGVLVFWCTSFWIGLWSLDLERG